jgi:salicylate hydroxylase
VALLERLDVANRLASIADEPQALDIKSAQSGRLLVSLPLGETARRRYGSPYWLLHRADLQATLVAAVGDEQRIDLRLDAAVTGAAVADDALCIETPEGHEDAHLLIAADGIHSTLRTSYFALPPASPLGATAWRTLLVAADVPKDIRLDATTLWMGPGFHAVHYPLRQATILNLVVVMPADGAGEGPTPGIARAPQLRAVLEAAREWHAWPLAAAAPGAGTAPRAVLVGDAAHAMAPSSAQGGAQAIEDAFVLAEMLPRHAPDCAQALAAFERIRRPRVERVVRDSARNLRLYGLPRIPAALRDMAIANLPIEAHLRRLDWLFTPIDSR